MCHSMSIFTWGGLFSNQTVTSFVLENCLTSFFLKYLFLKLSYSKIDFLGGYSTVLWILTYFLMQPPPQSRYLIPSLQKKAPFLKLNSLFTSCFVLHPYSLSFLKCQINGIIYTFSCWFLSPNLKPFHVCFFHFSENFLSSLCVNWAVIHFSLSCSHNSIPSFKEVNKISWRVFTRSEKWDTLQLLVVRSQVFLFFF